MGCVNKGKHWHDWKHHRDTSFYLVNNSMTDGNSEPITAGDMNAPGLLISFLWWKSLSQEDSEHSHWTDHSSYILPGKITTQPISWLPYMGSYRSHHSCSKTKHRNNQSQHRGLYTQPIMHEVDRCNDTTNKTLKRDPKRFQTTSNYHPSVQPPKKQTNTHLYCESLNKHPASVLHLHNDQFAAGQLLGHYLVATEHTAGGFKL